MKICSRTADATAVARSLLGGGGSLLPGLGLEVRVVFQRSDFIWEAERLPPWVIRFPARPLLATAPAVVAGLPTSCSLSRARVSTSPSDGDIPECEPGASAMTVP
jgi:hypothetical protein